MIVQRERVCVCACVYLCMRVRAFVCACVFTYTNVVCVQPTRYFLPRMRLKKVLYSSSNPPPRQTSPSHGHCCSNRLNCFPRSTRRSLMARIICAREGCRQVYFLSRSFSAREVRALAEKWIHNNPKPKPKLSLPQNKYTLRGVFTHRSCEGDFVVHVIADDKVEQGAELSAPQLHPARPQVLCRGRLLHNTHAHI